MSHFYGRIIAQDSNPCQAFQIYKLLMNQMQRIMKYVSQIEYDDLSDEYILPIPEDLLDSMGWVEGDMLRWEFEDDDTLILRKSND